MPPFLMSALFSLILNVFAPHANVVLPHLVQDQPVVVEAAEAMATEAR